MVICFSLTPSPTFYLFLFYISFSFYSSLYLYFESFYFKKLSMNA